jgi:DNA-binding MarR family transcriptional regulator
MHDFAAQMTDLTSQLFMSCQEREAYFVSLYDIKLAEFRCLRLLLQCEPCPVKDLAEMMRLTPSRLTRIIDGLLRRKFVSRIEDQSDRRVKTISLTVKGRDVAVSMNQRYLQMHQDILALLPEDSRGQTLNAIQQLLAAMRQWEQQIRTE